MYLVLKPNVLRCPQCFATLFTTLETPAERPFGTAWRSASAEVFEGVSASNGTSLQEPAGSQPISRKMTSRKESTCSLLLVCKALTDSHQLCPHRVKPSRTSSSEMQVFLPMKSLCPGDHDFHEKPTGSPWGTSDRTALADQTNTLATPRPRLSRLAHLST